MVLTTAVQGQDEAKKIGDFATFDLPGGTTIEMVWIEPGTFMMGSLLSERDQDSDEGPQHQVTIRRGFWLGKYELTQAQWESVMGTRPWMEQAFSFMVGEGLNHPAVYISWADLGVFVGELNEAEGREIYRLPTEAEWEYACRAGTTTKWSFGDDVSQLVEYAWYYNNAFDMGEMYAHAVGTKLPNPWGLYDMHGNVWEWCQDWKGSYLSGSQVDPVGLSSGSARVVRSGGFYYYDLYLRSANRNRHSPGKRDYFIGARLVRQEP
jgi:formylglycine-generating enzyme required for sulfatase activity